MNRSTLILALIVFIAFTLGALQWLNTNASWKQQITVVLKRIETLEQAVEALKSRSDSKPNDDIIDTRSTTEDVVDQDDLARITKRLQSLETLLTELSKQSLVERPITEEETVAQNIQISQTVEQYRERLNHLEDTIQALQHQLDMMFQSVSPVADLGSREAELIRANRYYHDLDEPSTAVQAYASLLERYELTYEETLMALTNSADSFDSAAQKRSSFVTGNASLLSLLEDRISQLQKEDQGLLFFTLANGCMHGTCYEDAYRLYRKAIQTLPDSKEKVSAYWSMSFAARYALGEDAFFETLSQGHKLGSELGLDVSSFEKEIDAPRERN